MSRLPAPATSAFAWPARARYVLAVLLAGWLAFGCNRLHAETLTLADCLRETVEHNPQIIEQRCAVEQATATRLTFRARALPTLNIGGILGYLGERNTETLRVSTRDPSTGKTVVNTVNNTRSGTELVIGTGLITQPIFDAAIPASWRRGDLTVTVAQENLYTVVAAQLNETRTLFYRALFQQENGALVHRIDDVVAGEVKTLGQLTTAGLVGRQASLAAQVHRTNFGPVLLANAGGLRVLQTNLLQSMGRALGPAAEVRLAGALEDRPLVFNAAAAAREALAQRPDIQGLRATVRMLNEDTNIMRAGYYPLIRVYVAGELIPQSFVQRTETNAVRQSDETQVTEIRPGVREDWAVVDTGAVRGGVHAAQAQSDFFSIAVRQAERDLPANLAAVHARMTDATDKISALRGNVGTAENTLSMVQAGLAQGLNSQLEFLNAQDGVLGTRAGLLAAELEMSLAHAEFDRLTGRYLKFTPEESAAPRQPPVRK